MASVQSGRGREPEKSLTVEQRKYQRALAKIRRLNTKLTEVKLLVNDLDKAVASGKTTVTTRQVNNWSNQLKKILNMGVETPSKE